MTVRPRPVRAPRVVSACWAASAATGGLLVALGPTAGADAQGLTPATLPRYLAQAAGPDARAIRVNGVYGSGRDGAWQFTAHLTWHRPDGRVDGGVLDLPQGAGAPTGQSPVDEQRLLEEEQVGWTLDELGDITADLSHADAVVALLELEVPRAGGGTVTFCSGSRTARGTCRSYDRSGRRGAAGDAELVVAPVAGALSVQRR